MERSAQHLNGCRLIAVRTCHWCISLFCSKECGMRASGRTARSPFTTHSAIAVPIRLLHALHDTRQAVGVVVAAKPPLPPQKQILGRLRLPEPFCHVTRACYGCALILCGSSEDVTPQDC